MLLVTHLEMQALLVPKSKFVSVWCMGLLRVPGGRSALVVHVVAGCIKLFQQLWRQEQQQQQQRQEQQEQQQQQ